MCLLYLYERIPMNFFWILIAVFALAVGIGTKAPSFYKMSWLDSLDKNGKTIYEGIIMSKDEVRSIKLDKIQARRPLFDYGEQVTDIYAKGTPTLAEFYERKKKTLDEMYRKNLTAETRNSIIQLIESEEKTLIYLSKFSPKE